MEFTTIRRAVKAFVTDSSDLDRTPDIVNASGKVTFDPALVSGDVVQDIDENGRPVSIALSPIEADILDGIIQHEGMEGIQLVAGGPNSNPRVIRWRASFKNMKAGSISFHLKPVTFDAIPGGEVDLTLVAPLAGASSTIVRGATGTSLHDVTLEGVELVVTVSDDAGVRELRRIPFENILDGKADKTQVEQLTAQVDKLTAQVMAISGGGTDPVEPDPEPEPTEVEAPAPSWTDNSDGGGEWTTPEVEGVEYSPASGTATPGQTVTVTATALDGYVIVGATEWTHTFPEEPESTYSFTIREDTAPVSDRKQVYALTAEKWAALSYLRDRTASNADPLGALNVALRSDAAEIIGVTSVTDRALIADGGTEIGRVRTAWLLNPSSAYNSFVDDIDPVITEISKKGALI